MKALDLARPGFYRALETSPELFCRYQGRFPDRHTVRAGTELVIEGYASAANSFTRVAFLLTNPGLEIASHLHSVAPLRLAQRRRLPALVLLREPAGSVASYLARFRRSDPARELRRYARFYSGLRAVRDHVCIVGYEDVTRDFASVVDRLNTRFGTSLLADPDGQAHLAGRVDQVILAEGERVFGAQIAERGALRSAQRDAVNAWLVARMEEPDLSRLLARARRRYEEVSAWADPPR